MISAERAREITKTAQAEENAYIKAVVEREAAVKIPKKFPKPS